MKFLSQNLSLFSKKRNKVTQEKNRKRLRGISEDSSLVSSRTGGFERPIPESLFLREDDTTLQDNSVYTDPERFLPDSVSVSCHSDATTVKAGQSPVFVEDIKPKLDLFKRAVHRNLARRYICRPQHPGGTSDKSKPTFKSFSTTGEDLTRQPGYKDRFVEPVQFIEERPELQSSRTNLIALQSRNPQRVSCQKASSDLVSYSKDGSVEICVQGCNEKLRPSDDDSYSSSVDLGSRFNMTDGSLMERSSSPGTLRLTAEGLQRHERKALEESVKRESETKYECWQKQRDGKRWLQEKHRDRDEKLFDKTLRIRDAMHSKQQANRIFVKSATAVEPPVSKRGFLSRLKFPVAHEDVTVTDLSLAPLNAMQQLNLAPEASAGPLKPRAKNVAGKVLTRFRRQQDSSKAVTEILEKERKLAKEALKKQRHLEIKEKRRIEAKRQAYLEEQRQREKSAGSRRELPLKAIERKESQDLSTLSSSRLVLPPCGVCGQNERTHIASPCMHFAFCEACFLNLERRPTVRCPLCGIKNVSFASVEV